MSEIKETMPTIKVDSLHLEKDNSLTEAGDHKETLYRHDTIRTNITGVDHSKYNSVRRLFHLSSFIFHHVVFTTG
jgi:hypothetical protein